MNTGQQEAVDAGAAVGLSDGSSAIAKIEGIPIPKLNFKSTQFNFEAWKASLEIALDMIDGMWDVVFKPPEELLQKQKQLDKCAYAYLSYAIGEEGRDLLRPRIDSANSLWTKIEGRFGRKLLSRELQSLETFLKLSMNSDDKIIEYVAKSESAWNEYLMVSGWHKDFELLTKEMRLRLEHLFFLKLLSGIGNHPERLYGVQLQTLRVQLSEDKLTLNSVVDLISTEEQVIADARGENLNQIALSTQMSNQRKPFTCHNCNSPNHFFRDCPLPLKTNLKSMMKSDDKRRQWKKKSRKYSKSNNMKMKGKSARRVSSSSSSNSVTSDVDEEPIASNAVIIGEALNASISGKQDKTSSIFDSGASHPLFVDTNSFSRYVSLKNVFVKVANGELIPVTHVGEVRLALYVDGIRKELIYKKAFVVPALDQNLLSLSKLWDNGYTFSSDVKTRSLLITNAETNELICRAPEKQGLFPLCNETWHGATAYAARNILSSTSLLWHQRYGHLHHQGLQRLARKKMVKGLIPSMVEKEFECEACIQGK